MQKNDTLPRWILDDVEEYLEANNYGCGVNDLTKRQILDFYLCWNGIVGYTDDIICVISELFDKIDEIDFDVDEE
jgi:hypothetical protein